MDFEKVQRADKTEKLNKPVEGWVKHFCNNLCDTSYMVSGKNSLTTFKKLETGILKIRKDIDHHQKQRKNRNQPIVGYCDTGQLTI